MAECFPFPPVNKVRDAFGITVRRRILQARNKMQYAALLELSNGESTAFWRNDKQIQTNTHFANTIHFDYVYRIKLRAKPGICNTSLHMRAPAHISPMNMIHSRTKSIYVGCSIPFIRRKWIFSDTSHSSSRYNEYRWHSHNEIGTEILRKSSSEIDLYARIRSKKKPHEHFSNEHSLQMSKLRKPVNTLAIKNSNTKDFVHVCHYHMAQGVVSTKLKKYERKKHLKISRRLTKFRIASHAEGSGLEPTAWQKSQNTGFFPNKTPFRISGKFTTETMNCQRSEEKQTATMYWTCMEQNMRTSNKSLGPKYPRPSHSRLTCAVIFIEICMQVNYIWNAFDGLIPRFDLEHIYNSWKGQQISLKSSYTTDTVRHVIYSHFNI